MHLELFVTNGSFSAVTDIYCNRDEMEGMGAGLKEFETKDYLYEYGAKEKF